MDVQLCLVPSEKKYADRLLFKFIDFKSFKRGIRHDDKKAFMISRWIVLLFNPHVKRLNLSRCCATVVSGLMSSACFLVIKSYNCWYGHLHRSNIHRMNEEYPTLGLYCYYIIACKYLIPLSLNSLWQRNPENKPCCHSQSKLYISSTKSNIKILLNWRVKLSIEALEAPSWHSVSTKHNAASPASEECPIE